VKQIEEIANTVMAAVQAGRLNDEEAQRLMGRMLFDAVGMDLSSDGDRWRHELIGLGVPGVLIEAAQADMRVVNVRVAPRAQPASARSDATDPADRVLAHMVVLGEPARWEAATTYESLALALMNAVWSIGVRYAGVLNVLERYRGARAHDGCDPDRDRPEDLVAFIDAGGGPDAFAVTVGNRQRTSSRSGVLKAQAVRLAAQVLVDASIESPEDLAEATAERLAGVRRRWTAIPGQGSGLSWDYFLMLSGLQGVKADRMVRRFVADALGVDEQAVSQREAHALVTDAATRLRVDVSQLDYAIWLHQSGNKPA